MVVIAIALSVSFVVASKLINRDDEIYSSYRVFWSRFQRPERLADDPLLDALGATIAIFGMGRVGSGAYNRMREFHGETVIGIDFDAELVKWHRSMERNVLQGDPSDADFWKKRNNAIVSSRSCWHCRIFRQISMPWPNYGKYPSLAASPQLRDTRMNCPY